MVVSMWPKKGTVGRKHSIIYFFTEKVCATLSSTTLVETVPTISENPFIRSEETVAGKPLN